MIPTVRRLKTNKRHAEGPGRVGWPDVFGEGSIPGSLPGQVAVQRERTSGAYKVNTLLGADGDNVLHVGSARHGKFLGTTRKKRLESRRTCLDKHSAWGVPDILESVNRVSRHEHDGTGSHLMPLIVMEESHLSLLNQKQFVLVRMIVWRRSAAGRSNLRPKGEFSSGLRTGKMDDNFFAKSMHYVTFATRQNHGNRFGIHLHETAGNVEN